MEVKTMCLELTGILYIIYSNTCVLGLCHDGHGSASCARDTHSEIKTMSNEVEGVQYCPNFTPRRDHYELETFPKC